MTRAAALLALPLLAACTAGGTPSCPTGTQAATIAEAYFGRNIRNRAPVTEAEWQTFLDEIITPAFPDGMTTIAGAGQWRHADGRIVAEQSKVVTLVLPGADATAARARLQPIEWAWKERFRQDSVLTVYRVGCVGF